MLDTLFFFLFFFEGGNAAKTCKHSEFLRGNMQLKPANKGILLVLGGYQICVHVYMLVPHLVWDFFFFPFT